MSHVTSSYVIFSTLPLGMRRQKNLLSHPLQKNFPTSGLKDHIYTDQWNRKEFRHRPTQIRPIFFTKDQFKEKRVIFLTSGGASGIHTGKNKLILISTSIH